MTDLLKISATTPHACLGWQARQLTHQSSMRENVFEHMLLGQLGAELLARGVDYDEFHASVDKDGFDVLLEAGKVQRHIQLKVKILGGARSEVSIHTGLAARSSGCVIWLTYDPVARELCEIRWFGGAPGEPLPALGDKVARHSRANAHGKKSERPLHRVIATSRFERLDDIPHLVDKLFGPLPVDPLAFIRSRLRPDVSAEPAWITEVANGSFTAIPPDLRWAESVPLAHMLDGYRLLDVVGDRDPSAFLDRQRDVQRETDRWPGDAALLWTTLFLEARADRFGSNDLAGETPHLDRLVRQLRDALVVLETANV